MIVARASLGVLVLLGGCFAHCRPPDGCARTETRCVGNVAQICDANAYWTVLADCDRVSAQSGARFVCEFVDEETDEGRITGHTCMPAAEAHEGGTR